MDGMRFRNDFEMGAGNIHHGYLHEKSIELLKGLYKSASFIVQAIVFKQTRCYIKRQKELLRSIEANGWTIIENFMTPKMERNSISPKHPNSCLSGQRNGLTRHLLFPDIACKRFSVSTAIIMKILH